VLPIQRVSDPATAHVLVLRRRPPLRRDDSGRTRASHGRSSLEILEVERGEGWRLEPLVKVQISPGQRSAALEATALHEFGHAFGLWGHSDDPGDAMAVSPGAQPVLRLSERDRATVRWLYSQPTRFGEPLPAAERSRESER
jgi:predicted Zn-dependent protease